ncbi:MmyB family transcriptional regulator [Nocardia pseudobrasiliensis]|uniref:MmyB-like transcription regulator ligand binding domain-containing protein n=1 Tax=Nocardia pseudobrasiliensis TaxID=45979 RepID=A0A370IFG0_9NOCA|nr:hypothetical protein [Nocardia pseudobrasiliensis]RDI69442.1 hypothetical protein DFR76_101983 [Nocardia pseudobrasiliensis]
MHPTDTDPLDIHPGPAANLTLDWDLVACNAQWRAIFTGLCAGENLLQWLFSSPHARQLPEWRSTARHMLLWYVDGQLSNGGNGHALAALRPLATTNRAIRSLLTDTDAAEVEIVFSQGAAIEVPDPGTGSVTSYRFDPISLVESGPVAYYTIQGTACEA